MSITGSPASCGVDRSKKRPRHTNSSFVTLTNENGHFMKAARIHQCGILVTNVSEPLPEHQENGVRVVFLVEVTPSRLDKIADLFEQSTLISRVGTVVPLEQARIAHEMLAGAPHKRGRLCWKWVDSSALD